MLQEAHECLQHLTNCAFYKQVVCSLMLMFRAEMYLSRVCRCFKVIRFQKMKQIRILMEIKSFIFIMR